VSLLCANSKQIKLNSISQVEKLIEESKASLSLDSCAPYMRSLVELEPVLARVKSGDTCDLDLVDLIRAYHLRFIAKDSSSKEDHAIPFAVRQFFLALGFQISAQCKMTLINNLEVDTRERITEADYAN